MQSVDDLFGIGEEGGSHAREHIKDIDISELSPFKDHPFRVLDDEKMQETMESIRGYGVLNPVIVRPKQPYGYEIIAGHRRKRACEILGFDKIPCVIRELSDEEGKRNAVPCFFLFTAAESRQDALSVLYIRKRGIYHGRYSV